MRSANFRQNRVEIGFPLTAKAVLVRLKGRYPVLNFRANITLNHNPGRGWFAGGSGLVESCG